MNLQDLKELKATTFLAYAEKLEIENVRNMNRQELIVAVVKKRFTQELPKLILLGLLFIAIMKFF